MHCFKFVILFICAHLVAHSVAQVQAQVPSQDDRVVSFSYNQGSTFQYTPDLPDYEEDTIFAPNSVNPPLGGPTPVLRFLGKGAGSEIETDAISYGYKHHPRQVNLLSAFFSVSPQSTGMVGSAVNNEGFDDRGSDIFASELTGSNRQVYDGNGLLMQPGAKKLDSWKPAVRTLTRSICEQRGLSFSGWSHFPTRLFIGVLPRRMDGRGQIHRRSTRCRVIPEATFFMGYP